MNLVGKELRGAQLHSGKYVCLLICGCLSGVKGSRSFTKQAILHSLIMTVLLQDQIRAGITFFE